MSSTPSDSGRGALPPSTPISGIPSESPDSPPIISDTILPIPISDSAQPPSIFTPTPTSSSTSSDSRVPSPSYDILSPGSTPSQGRQNLSTISLFIPTSSTPSITPSPPQSFPSITPSPSQSFPSISFPSSPFLISTPHSDSSSAIFFSVSVGNSSSIFPSTTPNNTPRPQNSTISLRPILSAAQTSSSDILHLPTSTALVSFSSNSVNVGAIVGVVIGATALLAISLAILYRRLSMGRATVGIVGLSPHHTEDQASNAFPSINPGQIPDSLAQNVIDIRKGAHNLEAVPWFPKSSYHADCPRQECSFQKQTPENVDQDQPAQRSHRFSPSSTTIVAAFRSIFSIHPQGAMEPHQRSAVHFGGTEDSRDAPPAYSSK